MIQGWLLFSWLLSSVTHIFDTKYQPIGAWCTRGQQCDPVSLLK